MNTYRTIDGEVLDAICKRELGDEAHVPTVLEANPHLADLGPIYAAGVQIVLPVVIEPVAKGEIRLWGRT